MKSPAEYIQIVERLCRKLTDLNDSYPALADARAEAEMDYKVEVRKQILSHKSDGHPVTIIPKLVEGHKLVSELKFKMDVCEALVKANVESCRSTVNQIDAARSILSWLKQELGGH